MSEICGFIFSAALINNLVLTSLVGLDLQIFASQQMRTAWLVGLITLCCLTLCLPVVYLVDHLLIIPYTLQYLDLLLYVMLIIVIVYASQHLIHRLFPRLKQQVDTVTPIILCNSILLATSLLSRLQSNTLFESFLMGIGTGTGFLLLLLMLTCLRERIDNEDVPTPFKGLPILLITLGILAMGGMGFVGL